MAELLNLARMAQRAGVTKVWLRDQAERGLVPSLKAGSRLLFNSDAVEATLAERAAKSESVDATAGA